MTGTDDDEAARLDAEWSTLMVAAQAGDRVAYKRLLHGSVLLIRRIVRWQGVQPDRIDEVTQETLLIVHHARQSYDPSRSFSAWLCAIARRRVIDNLGRRGRLDGDALLSLIADKSHSDPRTDVKEDHIDERRDRSVGEASNALPAGRRKAIEALARRQLSQGEATALNGRVKGAFRVTIYRFLNVLRDRSG